MLDEKRITLHNKIYPEARSSWKIHLRSWLNHPMPKIYIKYEELEKNTPECFKDLLDDMNTPMYKNIEKEIKELEQELVKLKRDPNNRKKTLKLPLNKSKLPVKEIAVAGGLVTGGGFTSANYMDFFGLNEEDKVLSADEIEKSTEAVKNYKKEIEDLKEMDAPIHIEALVDAAEAAYDAGMSTDEILEFIEQHLGLKMGDF